MHNIKNHKSKIRVKHPNKTGFTIIEVIIVLAIASLILILIFMAVPALKRSSRNNARRRDASLLGAAINQCLADHANNYTYCSNPAHIPLNPSKEFSIFTGFIYGADGSGNSVPPTDDEPNYLFHLECNKTLDWFINVGGPAAVVTYRFEVSGGWSPTNLCLDI